MEENKEHEKKMLKILICTFLEFTLGADNSEEVYKNLREVSGEEKKEAIIVISEGFIDHYYDEYKEYYEVVKKADFVEAHLDEALKSLESKCLDKLGTLRNIKSRGDC